MIILLQMAVFFFNYFMAFLIILNMIKNDKKKKLM